MRPRHNTARTPKKREMRAALFIPLLLAISFIARAQYGNQLPCYTIVTAGASSCHEPCLDTPPYDECEYWAPAAGETCRCKDVVQAYCCDIHIKDGAPDVAGNCQDPQVPAFCAEVGPGTCKMKQRTQAPFETYAQCEYF